jgi:hypothetical protein
MCCDYKPESGKTQFQNGTLLTRSELSGAIFLTAEIKVL